MCTIRRRDTSIYGSNNECIRVSCSQPNSGEVKLGKDGIIIIDEIMSANKADVEIVEEIIYQLVWVGAIIERLQVPNCEDIILNYCRLCCAIKASDVDQAGNGTNRTIQSTSVVVCRTTVNLDSRIFPLGIAGVVLRPDSQNDRARQRR